MGLANGNGHPMTGTRGQILRHLLLGPTSAVLLTVALLVGPASVHAEPSHQGSEKHLKAGRMAAPPVIDGTIRPGEWRDATVVSDFLQTSPNPGHAPKVPTLVLIGFDAQALYVAFRCSQRGLPIHQARSERDAVSGADTDWVAVMLDPYRDRRTGYLFQVSAAGIQGDGAIFQDGHLDMNWDGIWTSAVSRDDKGWSAEIAIPWNIINHPQNSKRPWGVQLRRRTVALAETDDWSPIPRGSAGLARHFGALEGLSHITKTLSLEIRPYVASGMLLHRQPGVPSAAPRTLNAGFDIRYGITSTLNLSLTLNPDFGQVELDPTVVNLTKYEVYFEERRPFFVEDADLFKTPLSIFYSRRVGAAPDLPDPTTAGGTITEAPTESPILFAAKLTGRAGGHWRVGALTAVVGPTYATEKTADGKGLGILASRTAVFSTVRAVRTLGRSSSLGLAMASVQRSHALDAYVLSADTSLRGRSAYSLRAQFLTSLEADNQGLGALVSGGRTQAPGWRWNATAAALSKHLDLNQTGFLSRNDTLYLTGQVSYLLPKPSRTHRSLHVGMTGSLAFNLDRIPVRRRLSFWSSHTFSSTWSLSYRYELRLPVYDDWTTSGGIPVALPKQHVLFASLASDSRHKIRGQIWSWVVAREDDSVATSSTALLSFQWGTWLQTSLEGAYTLRKNWLQFASSDDQDHPIFGRMDFDQIEASLHFQAAARRRLTVQLYLQYLYAAARYRPNAYFILRAKDHSEPYGDIGADWSLDALKINLRIRWQLDSATNLYLVATHIAEIDGADPKFLLATSLDRTWTKPATDLILFKLERRWLQ